MGRVHDRRTHRVDRVPKERIIDDSTRVKRTSLPVSLSLRLSLSPSSCFSISSERYFFTVFPRIDVSSFNTKTPIYIVKSRDVYAERVMCCRATRSRAYTLVRENHRSYTPRTRLRTSFDCPGWGARLDVANREQHCSACFSLLSFPLDPSLRLSLSRRHVLPPLFHHPYYLYRKFQPLRAGTHTRGSTIRGLR